MAFYLEIVTPSTGTVSSYGKGFQKTFWCHLHPGLLTARTSSLDDLMFKQKKQNVVEKQGQSLKHLWRGEGRGAS